MCVCVRERERWGGWRRETFIDRGDKERECVCVCVRERERGGWRRETFIDRGDRERECVYV